MPDEAIYCPNCGSQNIMWKLADRHHESQICEDCGLEFQVFEVVPMKPIKARQLKRG